MDVSSIVKGLELLTRPSAGSAAGSTIETLLQENIETLKSNLDPTLLNLIHVQSDGNEDVTWLFTQYCLHLLKFLCQYMVDCIEREKTDPRFVSLQPNEAPPLSSAALSIGHQKIIAGVFQFIGMIGISPNLSEGVGIPLEYKTNFKHLLIQPAKIPLNIRKHRLLKCINVLLECSRLPDLNILVLTLHLNDILASLCQLCYETDENGKSSCTCSEQNQICASTQCCKKVELEKCLLELMDRVRPELVIKEIMILQGSSGKMKPSIRGLEKPALSQSPPWLRRVCGRLLSEQLMKQDGVRHVTVAMLEGSSDEAAEWRKCEVLAGIVATCPRHVELEKYVANICGQLLAILRHNNVIPWRTRIVNSCIRALYRKYPELTSRNFLEIILEALKFCLHPPDGNLETVADEILLMDCVQQVHEVFLTRVDDNLMKCLVPFCHPLFSLYARSRNGVSLIRKTVRDILMTLFKNLESDDSFRLLLALAYNAPCQLCGMEARVEKVEFVLGSQGGYCALCSSSESVDNSNCDRVGALTDLVLELQTDGVASRFFLHLLQELTEIVSGHHSNQSYHDDLSSAIDLLTLEEREERLLNRRLVVIRLLGELSEKLNQSCIQDPSHVIAFSKATLERGIYVLLNSSDDITSLFENETLTMAMSLLTALMGGACKLSDENRVAMETLLPLLNDLAIHHPDNSIREMATDIRIAIATRGAVLGKVRKDDKKTEDIETEEHIKTATVSRTEAPKKPLIEVICETNHNVKEVKTEIEDGTQFQKSLKELCDPLVPVRGHALITLRKLIQNGDQETLQNKELVKNILLENLDHPDTYIYLSAIEGLALYGDRYPKELLPILCEKFNEKKSLELRMKLGEVLVKISRGLGEMTSYYASALIGSFLKSARDEVGYIRASALYNLGQVCQLLRWSLAKHVHEICACCTSLLRSDPETEVRRAAAAMIHQLLDGLDRNTFKVMDTALRDVYRALKLALDNETDEAILTHARQALTSLDDIMTTVLFPKMELRKEIRIKDPF